MNWLKKYSPTDIYETILWVLFLVFTFLVGFYHGSSPENQLSFYFQNETRVAFLTYDRQTIDPAVIKWLETKHNVKISIIERPNYKDFRTELIINKNIAFFIAPEAFIKPLATDNRIKNLKDLYENLSKSIHDDFISNDSYIKEHSIPFLWFINVYVRNKTKIETLSEINFSSTRNIRNRFHELGSPKKILTNHDWTQKIMNADLIETTIQQASRNNKNFEFIKGLSKLYIFSLGVPNMTPDLKLSKDLIRTLITDSNINIRMKPKGLGYAFDRNTDNLSIEHYISPKSLRNIPFEKFEKNSSTFNESLWN